MYLLHELEPLNINYPCTIRYEGKDKTTHYFPNACTMLCCFMDMEHMDTYKQLDGPQAWSLYLHDHPEPDIDKIKDRLCYIIFEKMKQHPEIKDLLLRINIPIQDHSWNYDVILGTTKNHPGLNLHGNALNTIRDLFQNQSQQLQPSPVIQQSTPIHPTLIPSVPLQNEQPAVIMPQQETPQLSQMFWNS